MAPPPKRKLADAGVATDRELNEIADEFGIFATAEETTMDRWVAATRISLAHQIGKTRSELQRLDRSLTRLAQLAQARLGRPDSTRAFDAEYAALEGWSLTLIANYIALAGLGDRAQQDARFGRASDYLRGAITLAQTHQPGQALAIQQPVLNALFDQSLFHP